MFFDMEKELWRGLISLASERTEELAAMSLEQSPDACCALGPLGPPGYPPDGPGRDLWTDWSAKLVSICDVQELAIERFRQLEAQRKTWETWIDRAAEAATRLDIHTCEIGNRGGCPRGHMGPAGASSGAAEPWSEQIAKLEMICAVQRSVLEKVRYLEDRIEELSNAGV